MTYFSIVLTHKLLDGNLLIFVNKYKQNRAQIEHLL